MKDAARAGEGIGGKVLLLVLLCAVLYLPGISLRDPWRPDEVRYTEVAREMEATGSFFLPRLNGEPYADKPPLFFWLTILAKKPFGAWSPVPARLVSAGAALATVLITFFLARALGLAAAALPAGLVLATTAEFLWMARWGAMDTLFTFFITLSLYAFVRNRDEPSTGRLAVAYLAASLAILAKGPLGVLIPGAAAALTVLFLEGPRGLRARSLGWGIPLMLVPVVAWLVPDIIQAGGWSHGREVLFHQNLGRLSGPGSHHQPLTYYLINFPADFLPWTLFLPGGLYVLFRDRSLPREARAFLGAYFLGILLLLSLIPPKREKYLLPIYPGAALIVGCLLASAGGTGRASDRWIRIPSQILAWTAAAAGPALAAAGFWGTRVAARLVPAVAPEVEAVIGAPPARVSLVLTGLVVTAAGLFTLRATRREPAKASLRLACVLLPALSVGIGAGVLPRADAFKSARPFCETLAGVAGPGRTIGVYGGIYQGIFNYHLGRLHLPVLHDPAELDRFLDGEGAPVVIIRRKHLLRLPASQRARYRVLLERRFETYTMAVVARVPTGGGSGPEEGKGRLP